MARFSARACAPAARAPSASWHRSPRRRLRRRRARAPPRIQCPAAARHEGAPTRRHRTARRRGRVARGRADPDVMIRDRRAPESSPLCARRGEASGDEPRREAGRAPRARCTLRSMSVITVRSKAHEQVIDITADVAAVVAGVRDGACYALHPAHDVCALTILTDEEDARGSAHRAHGRAAWTTSTPRPTTSVPMCSAPSSAALAVGAGAR